MNEKKHCGNDGCRCGNQLPNARQLNYFMHRLAHNLPDDVPDYLIDAKEQCFAACMDLERAIERWQGKPIFCMTCPEQLFDYAEHFCAACKREQEVSMATFDVRYPELAFPFPMLEAGPAICEVAA